MCVGRLREPGTNDAQPCPEGTGYIEGQGFSPVVAINPLTNACRRYAIICGGFYGVLTHIIGHSDTRG